MKRPAESLLTAPKHLAHVKWTKKDAFDVKRSLAKLSKDFPSEDFAERRTADLKSREILTKQKMFEKMTLEREQREKKATLAKNVMMSGDDGDEVTLYDDSQLYHPPPPPEKKVRVADTSLEFKPYKLHVGVPYWLVSGGKSKRVADNNRISEFDISDLRRRIGWLINRHRNKVGSRSTTGPLEVVVYTLDDMGLPKDVVQYVRGRPGVIWNRAMLVAFIDRWVLGKPPDQVPGYELLESKELGDKGRPLDMWVIPARSRFTNLITAMDGKTLKAHLNIKREKEWIDFASVTKDGSTIAPMIPYGDVLEYAIALSPLFPVRRVFFWYLDTRADLFYRRDDMTGRYKLQTVEQIAKQLSDDSLDTPVILTTNGDAEPPPVFYYSAPGFLDEKGVFVPVKDGLIELKPAITEFIQKWNENTAYLLWSIHPEVIARQVGQLQKLDLGLTAFNNKKPPVREPNLQSFPPALVSNVKNFMGKVDLKEGGGEVKRTSLAIGVVGLSNDPLTMSRVEAVVGLIYKYGGKFLPPGAGIEFVCLDQLPLASEEDNKDYFFTKDNPFHKGAFMEDLFLQYASDKTTTAETRRIDVWMLDYPGLSRSVAGYDYDSTSINDHVLAFHHLVATKVSTERVFAFKKLTDAGGTRLGAVPLQFDRQAQTYVTAVDKRRIRVLYEGADEEVVGNCLKWILQKHPGYKQLQVKALPNRVPDDVRDLVGAFTSMKFQSSSSR
jgi:hypothetical protein